MTYSSNITIIPCSGIFASEAKAISDDELGHNYLLESDFYTASSSINGSHCFVATSGREVIGFIIYHIIAPHELSFFESSKRINPIVNSEPIGLLKSVAVTQEWKRKGVGTKMIYHMLDQFASEGLKEAYCVAWKKENTINISRLMNKFDFQRKVEVENYWRKDSLEQRFICPICGNPPCLCSAVIYKKQLNNPNSYL